MTVKFNLFPCVTTHLSGQILLHVVPGNEDPTFEAPTLQLQVLPLSPEQVGLLLCLVDGIVQHQNHVPSCARMYSETSLRVASCYRLQTWLPDLKVLDVLLLLGQPLLLLFLRCRLVLTQFLAQICFMLEGRHFKYRLSQCSVDRS